MTRNWKQNSRGTQGWTRKLSFQTAIPGMEDSQVGEKGRMQRPGGEGHLCGQTSENPHHFPQHIYQLAAHSTVLILKITTPKPLPSSITAGIWKYTCPLDSHS